MRTVMVAPGATPGGTRTRTNLPSGALTVMLPPAGRLGGIRTRMSVAPGGRGGGRGGGAGGGAGALSCCHGVGCGDAAV